MTLWPPHAREVGFGFLAGAGAPLGRGGWLRPAGSGETHTALLEPINLLVREMQGMGIGMTP